MIVLDAIILVFLMILFWGHNFVYSMKLEMRIKELEKSAQTKEN